MELESIKQHLKSQGVKFYHEEKAGIIINADCLTILPKIPEKSIDLVLTDPPYNEVNRTSNGLRIIDKGDADALPFELETILPLLLLACMGSFYLFCPTEQISALRRWFVMSSLSTRHGYWEKDNPSPMNGENIYLSACENIIFAKKSGAVFNGFCRKPIWKAPVVTGQIHPTRKPYSIIADMVSVSSDLGDIILDPFLGSGTTAVAAKQLGRQYLGIEISSKYCEVAVERLRQEELF